jgi:hypothetical protein
VPRPQQFSDAQKQIVNDRLRQIKRLPAKNRAILSSRRGTVEKRRLKRQIDPASDAGSGYEG